MTDISEEARLMRERERADLKVTIAAERLVKEWNKTVETVNKGIEAVPGYADDVGEALALIGIVTFSVSALGASVTEAIEASRPVANARISSRQHTE